MVVVPRVQMVDDLCELRDLFAHLVVQVRVFRHGGNISKINVDNNNEYSIHGSVRREGRGG